MNNDTIILQLSVFSQFVLSLSLLCCLLWRINVTINASRDGEKDI